jgi:hypothetical protein
MNVKVNFEDDTFSIDCTLILFLLQKSEHRTRPHTHGNHSHMNSSTTVRLDVGHVPMRMCEAELVFSGVLNTCAGPSKRVRGLQIGCFQRPLKDTCLFKDP